jgi:transposase
VEQWAELRREHFVAGKSIKELARETGLSRNTIRKALRCDRPPVYERAAAPRVLDPFKAEIHRLLAQDPNLPGVRVRVRELLEPLGCTASRTVVDATCARSGRCSRRRPGAFSAPSVMAPVYGNVPIKAT